MQRRILFATPCHWMKFDMDPDAALDHSTPARGTLCATDAALEFSGSYKTYGGTLLAGAVTALLVRLLGEVTFSIPFSRICRIEAIQFTSRLFFLKRDAVRLEVLYRPDAPGDGLRKLVAFPHFGLEPTPEPGRFHLDPEIGSLYQPQGAEAFNWERILRYLVEPRRVVQA